jgi:hypothetical protein
LRSIRRTISTVRSVRVLVPTAFVVKNGSKIALAVLVRDAGARVGDGEDHVVALAARRDPDDPALLGLGDHVGAGLDPEYLECLGVTERLPAWTQLAVDGEAVAA